MASKYPGGLLLQPLETARGATQRVVATGPLLYFAAILVVTAAVKRSIF
jgi:hypothetical protein